MSTNMYINTESLAEAGRILRTRPLTDMKKAYVGALHRFTKKGKKLVVRTTDHRSWVRLELPYEGGEDENDWDMWLDGTKINRFFSAVDGGKMTIHRNDAGKLSFTRDNFNFTIKPETAPGEVRELEDLIATATLLGKFSAVMLVDVLAWCRPYIFTNSSDPNRQVMTIDEKGVAVAGLQEQFVKASGLQGVVQVSLNEQNASMMEQWLKAIKEDSVEVLATENRQHLIFREAGSSNYLAMVWESRRCPLLDGDPDLKEIGDELIHVDRAWLVSRLRMLEIAMEDGMNTVAVKIEGQKTQAGADKAAPAMFTIAVDGEDQAADVMQVVRRKSDITYEFRVDLQQLKHAAEKQDTLNLVLSYLAELGALQVENEAAADSGATIHKVCLIKTRVTREEKDEKKLKKDEKQAKVADTM